MDMQHPNPDTPRVLPLAGDGEPGSSLHADLRRLDRVLLAYMQDDDTTGATVQVLLSETENLRRFVMMPGALRDGLRQSAAGRETLGRRLALALLAMIARVAEPSMVALRAERLALDRTSRRAVSCLAYLGTIDPGFISGNAAH